MFVDIDLSILDDISDVMTIIRMTFTLNFYFMISKYVSVKYIYISLLYIYVFGGHTLLCYNKMNSEWRRNIRGMEGVICIGQI